MRCWCGPIVQWPIGWCGVWGVCTQEAVRRRGGGVSHTVAGDQVQVHTHATPHCAHPPPVRRHVLRRHRAQHCGGGGQQVVGVRLLGRGQAVGGVPHGTWHGVWCVVCGDVWRVTCDVCAVGVACAACLPPCLHVPVCGVCVVGGCVVGGCMCECACASVCVCCPVLVCGCACVLRVCVCCNPRATDLTLPTFTCALHCAWPSLRTIVCMAATATATATATRRVC